MWPKIVFKKEIFSERINPQRLIFKDEQTERYNEIKEKQSSSSNVYTI